MPTHMSSVQMLQTNPYILFLDCTYRTNKYGMPLFDIVGVNGANFLFYAGFAFLNTENQHAYEFALSCVRELYQDQMRLPITTLRTVLVDKDQALINAIESRLPHVKYMPSLCCGRSMMTLSTARSSSTRNGWK